MMRPVPVALVLALASCSHKPGPPENQAAATEKVTAEANAGDSSATSKLPPANAEFRFVGKWAPAQAECASKAWEFTKDSLSGGGPHCSFYKVTKSAAGYDIAATCPAKEPVHTDLIKLRFAESAGAMLVESNAIPPTGLIYCGK